MGRVLVTGGAGMIGSNLVKNLISRGEDVSVVDNLWRGRKENLLDSSKPVIDMEKQFHELDLTSYENCKKSSEGVETVYHLADVVAGIRFVFGNQHFLYRINTLINSNMLQAAIDNGVKKYIYVGTACSFPQEKQTLNAPPLKEEDTYPAHPESAYGWSKLMGEYECELAKEQGALDVGILRFHNVFGPPSELSEERSQVIPALCRKAFFAPEKPFIVWGSGAQKRAFVYVDDIIDALVRVRDRGMNQGVIQIGPDTSVSIREIAETIVEISGKKIDIQFDPKMPEGDQDRTADWSKAKNVLGWEPKTSIRAGLEKTYRWCTQELSR